jgi:hypothetical protein
MSPSKKATHIAQFCCSHWMTIASFIEPPISHINFYVARNFIPGVCFVTLGENPYEGWVMAGSELVVAYRLNAANCVEMAKTFPEPEKKLVLLDMANAWLRLADITAKFDDAVPDGQSEIKTR